MNFTKKFSGKNVLGRDFSRSLLSFHLFENFLLFVLYSGEFSIIRKCFDRKAQRSFAAKIIDINAPDAKHEYEMLSNMKVGVGWDDPLGEKIPKRQIFHLQMGLCLSFSHQ